MSRRAFKFLPWPALMLIVLTATALLARPLLPVDETRYAGVAWEMWSKGDFLVMSKNGEPYSHKPPLLFWLYDLGWALFGVQDWWPRLASLPFALGGLLLTGDLARRLWPEQANAERNAVWILGSSLLWMVFATAVMFDMLLAFFVLLGLYGLLIAVEGSPRRGFAWLGLAMGLGILTKGPVMLLHVLPVALLAPWWRPGISGRRWYGGIALAVAGGALIALTWAVPAAIYGGPEYRDAIFWGQTANRMVESFAHQRPLWWYVPLLPILLFPWLAWPALWLKLAALRRAGPDHGTRFCLAWMLPVFVAFSFISGKQVHYLLPLFPPFALLAGRALAKTEHSSLWLPSLLFGLLGVAMLYVSLAGLPGKAQHWDRFPPWPGVILLITAVSAGFIGKRRHAWLPALSGLSGTAFLLVMAYVSHNAWAHYDVGPMALAIKRLQDRGVSVAHAGRYHDQYQFAGRLQRPIIELTPERIPTWLAKHPQGALVSDDVLDALAPDERRGQYLFSQPYRGKIAILLSAEQAKAWPSAWQNRRDDSPRDNE